jgi:carboxyl-terminal processing protease
MYKSEKGSRFVVPAALMLVVLLLVTGAGITGYQFGIQKTGSTTTLQGERPNLATFWEAWNILDKNFYGTPTTETRLDGAISGMVSGLGDPYTAYLAPEQDQLFRSGLEGSFGGIGAELEILNKQLTIVAPLQGSPAEASGLEAGDIIVKIDGVEASTLSFSNAITKIRGEKGTEVKLSIQREGEQALLEIAVVRDTIVIKSVASENIGVSGQVAYIKVNQFGDDTTKLFREALEKAVTEEKRGAIIDLRNNPGGFLVSAVDTIGMVLPEVIDSTDSYLSQRIAVREKKKGDKEEKLIATTSPIAERLPLVVLVNGGSASASEIFAGAMKDYGRALVLGEKTFGKGSVQELVPLKTGRGGSIKVTIANWLTPKGTEINGVGVTPDREVMLAEGEKISSSDSQVAAALEQLGGIAKK